MFSKTVALRTLWVASILAPRAAWAESASHPRPSAFTPGSQRPEPKPDASSVRAFERASLVMTFGEGNAEVSEADKIALRSLIEATRSDRKGRKVFVAAWADRAIPEDGRKAAGNDGAKLAEERIDEVKRALADTGADVKVVGVNLAKSPALLHEFLGTKSAKVGNKALHDVDSNDARLNEAGKVIQDKGGARKVVVYIQQ